MNADAVFDAARADDTPRKFILKEGDSVTISFHAVTNKPAVQATTQSLVFVAIKDSLVPLEPLERTFDQMVKTISDVIPRFDPLLS